MNLKLNTPVETRLIASLLNTPVQTRLIASLLNTPNS